MTAPAQTQVVSRRNVQVHPLSRRIMHWINAGAILVMIGSGWRIYNYYPALPIHFGFPLNWTLGGDFRIDEAVGNEDGLANALLWHFAAMWVLVSFSSPMSSSVWFRCIRRDFLDFGGSFFARLFCGAARTPWPSARRIQCRAEGLILGCSGSHFGYEPLRAQYLEAGATAVANLVVRRLRIARVVHFFGMAAIVGFLVVHLALTALVPKILVAMIVGRASDTPHPREGE